MLACQPSLWSPPSALPQSITADELGSLSLAAKYGLYFLAIYLFIGASFEFFSLGALLYAAFRCGPGPADQAFGRLHGALHRPSVADAPCPPPTPLVARRYSTNADTFLVAVQEIAGSSTGLSVVDQANKVGWQLSGRTGRCWEEAWRHAGLGLGLLGSSCQQQRSAFLGCGSVQTLGVASSSLLVPPAGTRRSTLSRCWLRWTRFGSCSR